jgi:GntR family transcriptional regulator
MLFQLDFTSGKPVYLQLVEQVKVAAASGAIRPGDALPGIRSLAEHLRVNRNTVARAYDELEAQGVVDNVQGKGSFIRAAGVPALRKEARRRLLAETLEHAAVHAHHLQLGKADFLRVAEDRFDVLEDRRVRAEEDVTS